MYENTYTYKRYIDTLTIIITHMAQPHLPIHKRSNSPCIIFIPIKWFASVVTIVSV